MKNFINDYFLLQNDKAIELYNNVKDLPIIDYHCHLPPDEIANNTSFDNISQAWLKGDHYKWRAMRTLGVDEKYITGNTSDEQKFKHWASTVPYAVLNPLYHWTHLEMKRYFDIDDLLSEKNHSDIYQQTSEKLRLPEFSTQGLINKMNVEHIGTTDDPLYDMEFHDKIKAQGNSFKVTASFRPDGFMNIEADGFLAYIEKSEGIYKKDINSIYDLIDFMGERVDFFHEKGCRISDHGLGNICAADFDLKSVNNTFKKRKDKLTISLEEIEEYKSAILVSLFEKYHEKEWVQQLHLGALRNNNTRKLSLLGPDTGWDSIGDFPQAENLSKFLNHLNKEDKLGKTIIYNLNPADNYVFAAMIGNFNEGTMKGKVQYGASWWFLDQKKGIEDHFDVLSSIGLISCFIGMLTDSRSFLSYPRHEYFRRLLCNYFGEKIVKGELPNDINWLTKILKDICYYNAKEYFKS